MILLIYFHEFISCISLRGEKKHHHEHVCKIELTILLLDVQLCIGKHSSDYPFLMPIDDCINFRLLFFKPITRLLG